MLIRKSIQPRFNDRAVLAKLTNLLRTVLPGAALAGMFCLGYTSRAGSFVTTVVQASGQNWNGNIWSNTVTHSTTLVGPAAGNSYEVLSGSLIRPPTSASSPNSPLVFPGDSLQFDAGGSIRLKSSGPPAPGYFTFNDQGGKLVLNGGELDAGDDMLAVIFSTVQVVTNTTTRINGAQDANIINISNGTRNGFRNYMFYGGLSGGGSLTLGNAEMYNSPQVTAATLTAIGTTNANFIFRATSATYAGNIQVTSGWLQAAAVGAFGSANIIIAGTSNAYPNTTTANTPGAMGPAQFDATLAFSDPGTLTIQNTNSFLLLDTNLTFGGAVVDGVTLAYGTYTAAQINALTGNTNVVDSTGVNTLTISSNVVIVPVAPAIISQTQSRTNFPGDTVQLQVVATGTAPLTYQWKAGAVGSGVYTNLVNAGNLTGVSNSVLTMTNITVGNQADYIVVVANVAGSATSSVPTSLYVPPLTVIGPTPAAASVYAGGNVTFSVNALGSQPIAYQWLKIVAGVTNEISGATNQSLTLNNVGAGDAASYQVLVTNSLAATNSQLATLALVGGPADSYGQAMMSLGPVAYWRLSEGSGTNAYDYAGGHFGTYGASAFLTDPGPPYSGFPAGNTSLGSLNGTPNTFMTVTANNALNLNTNTVTITAWVNPTTLNPKVGIVFERNQAVGSTDVEGLNLTTNSTLGYTWNNSAASLAWDSGLTLPTSVWSFVALVVTPTNTTIYLYNTSQQTNAILATANAPAAFAGQLTINNDTSAADSTRIFGADTAEVSIFGKALSSGQIAQLFTAGSGQAVAPIISSGPQPTAVLPGHSAQFSVSAGGTSPLSYYWLMNGTNLTDGGQISGSATPALSISGVSSLNVGPYSVIVSNSAGSVTSSVASLTMLPAPTRFQNLVLQPGALGYWPLNETAGTSAYDYSGNNLHGTYVSPAALGGTGPNPPYVGFDGSDNLAPTFSPPSGNSYVSLPSFGVTSSNMSFAAWVYPVAIAAGTNQAPSAGIIFNRSSTVSGLCYKSDGMQLGYNWNNDPATYGHSSGLIPPTNQWSFVALVVTPTNSTLYLYNTNGAATSFFQNVHGPSSFTGETRIGSDAQGGRNFNGGIEQAVVYNYALSASQIAQVYTNGSGVPLIQYVNLSISSPTTGQIQLTWPSGTLLEATNLAGPWINNNATSPYTVPTTAAAQKFYRIGLH